MPTINRLSAVDSVASSDQIPIYSSDNGDARKASMSVIKEFMNEGVPTSLLDISSLFAMRIVTPTVFALTTAYLKFANWAGSLITPSGRDSLLVNTVLGEFVAARDISHGMVYCTLSGEWPANRDLELAVLVGTDAAPYESTFKCISAGRGAGTPLTASFSGPVANLNNPGNIILAGEKIRLVAKFNVADNLTVNRLAFVVQTLDGI